MSVFSESLKYYTDKCGITVVSLAKQCGVDRTTLHKILSGERRPPNEEFIITLSRVLMLTAAERDRLIEQYEISLVGDGLFQRRRQVSEVIRKLSELSSEPVSGKAGFLRKTRPSGEKMTVYSTKQDLMRAFYPLFASELENGSDIDIITQPSEEFCLMMKYASPYYTGGRIRHIFCLDNREGEGDAFDHNLSLFPGICELSYIFSNYVTLYYYDHTDSHINSATLLPVMVVSDSFVMRAELSMESGVIVRSDSVVDFFRQQFNRMKSMCYPFVERAGKVAGMFGNGQHYHDYVCTVDFQPSLMLVTDSDEIRQTLTLSDEQMERFLQKSDFLKKRYLTQEYLNVFTAAGLRGFLRTGVVRELPEEVCRPIPPEMRLAIVRRIIESCEKKIYDFRIIDEDAAPSDKLRINLDVDGTVHFVLRSKAEYVFMTVGEQSVKTAINDYFTHLTESGRIMDRERSLKIIRSVYASVEAEISEEK